MVTETPGGLRRGRLGYAAAVVLVLAAVVVGAGLGGVLLPQYFHPVFSGHPQAAAPQQPSVPSAAPPANPPAAQVPAVPAPAPAAGLTPDERVVINVVKRVRPSVVNIDTEAQVQTMFGVFPQQGAGSGVIVRSDGYILTNNHVVQGAQTIKVTLLSGKVLTGKIVGTDPIADLAVIKVASPESLPAAQLGSSGDLQVGQTAIAIGNPFGLGSTVTTGVISALNRNIQLPNLIVENLIQTSALINPGNSGGALVDTSGHVVGINTAIIPNAQGIGFAIPSDLARSEMQQLIALGHIVRPWVGIVYGGDVDAQTAQAYNLGAKHGVLVRSVESGSPAAKAGIASGDIVTAVGSEQVDTWSDFVRDIVNRKIGDTVTLTVVRGTGSRQVPVVLAERPAEPK
ncbi:MAG TPA: trypsin-like peptidase domain-containing protein [bacterium]|nr:trypsin-like peptidase domain-containing protein [bacterium]